MLRLMTWTLLTMLLLMPHPPGVHWQWPLRPPHVVRAFTPPAHPWDSGHRGIDLAAKAGQPVYAAGSGRVGYAKDLAGRGVITLIHGPLRTTYLPVRPSVRTGATVASGDRIGTLEDRPGHCPISCLHWGLLRARTYLDPLTLLGLGPVRLLPQWDVGPAPPLTPPQQPPVLPFASDMPPGSPLRTTPRADPSTSFANTPPPGTPLPTNMRRPDRASPPYIPFSGIALAPHL